MFKISKTSYSYDNDVLGKFNIKQNFRSKTIVIETFIKFVQSTIFCYKNEMGFLVIAEYYK